MNKLNLIKIAMYLNTRCQNKGHGSWLIYEDDKIRIMYDTYFPNVDVSLKIDGDTYYGVYSSSGHGIVDKYKPGKWEFYCNEILLPKAIEVENLQIEDRKRREEQERLEKFGPIDDSKIFAS